jgi:hypothetical protein
MLKGVKTKPPHVLLPGLSFAQTCPIEALSNFKIVAANFIDSCKWLIKYAVNY